MHGCQRDRGIGAIGEEHHDAGLVLTFEDSAEEMVGTKVRYPGQRALDDVAALDLAAFQFQLLDPEKALHRIGQTGAAENFPGCEFVGEFCDQLRIARIRRVPDQRVLAPRHEGGSAANFAERCDRLNGAAQIRRAIRRLMAAPRADIAEPPEQCVRIDRAFIDSRRLGCEVFSRDGRDLIGDRC